MSNNVDVNITIRTLGETVVKKLTTQVVKAKEAVTQLGASVSEAAGRIGDMASKAIVFDTATRAIRSLQGAVQGIAGGFDSFEQSMRKANTMAGQGAAGYQIMKNEIRELSKSIPLLREQLAEGLYQAISNGVPEVDQKGFLEQSAKAAVGGVADLGQTIGVTATIIKNYGREWYEAGEIQDKIQLTAKNGVTSFELLAQSLPRVTGSAAQLGVEIDELMATFATATGVTGNTSEVSTQLAAVLNSLIKPSSEATRAAAAMGISFDAASIKACGGFQNFLIELDKSVQEYAASSGQLSQTIYGQLFGSAEALRLLGSLTGEQKDTFAANIAAMNDSAGTIDAAYEQMTAGAIPWTITLKNQVLAATDWIAAIASMSAPAIEFVGNAGEAIIALTQLKNVLGASVGVVKALGVAIRTTAAWQGVIAAATKTWTIAQAALNAVLSLNPIGLVIIAVTALVAAVIYAYNKCEAFRNICDKVWAAIKVVASVVWDYLVKAFEKASEVIQTAWEWVKNFFGISDGDDAAKVAGQIDRQTASTEKLAGATEYAGLKAKESIDWQKMSYQQLGEAIERQKAKVAGLAGTNAATAKSEAELLHRMEARYKRLGKDYNLDNSGAKEFDGKSLIANAKSYKELSNNITYYREQLEKTSPAQADQIARLSRLIAETERSRDAIAALYVQYSQPAQLETLGDIDRAIEYQRSLRDTASAAQLANIDKEIKRLEQLKESMEDAAHAPVAIDQITSYRQLQDELSYYERQLQVVTVDQRAQVQQQIVELKKLKQSWDDALSVAPEPIAQLNTVDELDKAIANYTALAKKASAEEATAITRTIIELERKRDMLTSLTELPRMEAEIASLGSMAGKPLKMRLELIGLEKIKANIRQLQSMLDDRINPLDDKARAEVHANIEAWKRYENQLQRSNMTAANVWGGIRGIGNGVRSLSEALQSNSTIWDRLTAVVDTAIGLYQSFAQVGQVVKVITDAIGISKKTEAAETTALTAATAAGAAGSVAASAGEVAAATAVTNAKIEEAAAKTIAAHASIPWAGIAIAGGMVAAMTGIMLALPKFANGGIAYGPTMGIFGEYAGAANNPEVVAPLDKLKALIGTPDGKKTQNHEFLIRAGNLVTVSEKERRRRSRT